MQQLDTSWEALSTQTSWILKPCSKPADVGNSTQASLDGSAQVQLDTPNTDSETPTSDSDSQQSTSISTDVNQASLAASVSETPQNQPNSASAQLSQQDHPNTRDPDE